MARAKVTHSRDACQITFYGDKRRLEPSTAVVKFPGGFIQVSRCEDDTYWAHIAMSDSANVVESRIDLQGTEDPELRAIAIRDIPHGDKVNHIAIRIADVVSERP